MDDQKTYKQHPLRRLSSHLFRFMRLRYPKHTQPDSSSQSENKEPIPLSDLDENEIDYTKTAPTELDVLPGYEVQFLVHKVIYEVLSFLDPPPRMKPGETVSEYVFRVEKRHAIRRLNFHINTYPNFPLQRINRGIVIAKSKMQRIFYYFVKHYIEKRDKYILLREQIRERE